MIQEKLDIIITFGDEAEQYVRYFSDYWPSFESAGVFIQDRRALTFNWTRKLYFSKLGRKFREYSN